VDLGDRWSFYCVLDEAGKIILEQKVSTTPEAIKQTFGKIPQSLIAMETGTHSPWVSRLSDIPALKPYWGKPAVRNFREGYGNVGIIRSPLRAIALPDQSP
jgi:hypothetical protein